jgi:hypothetical protein
MKPSTPHHEEIKKMVARKGQSVAFGRHISDLNQSKSPNYTKKSIQKNTGMVVSTVSHVKPKGKERKSSIRKY